MNNILLISIPLLLILESCDKIESPYSEPVIVAGGDTVQNVLLEDYTGHLCPNCPAAHAEAQVLKNTYKNQLVIISIHTGFYARTQNNPDSSYRYDFRTVVGDAIFNAFVPASEPFPTGVVQRKNNDQNRYPSAYANWGTYLARYVPQKPEAFLKIDNTFNTGARTISSTVTTKFLKDVQDSLSLCLLYTQDSIIEWQKNGTIDIANYVHRHVLRGAINGTWGEFIGKTFTNQQTLTKSYTGNAIQSDAVPEQISVVAILYKSNTREVIQVEEQKLLP